MSLRTMRQYATLPTLPTRGPMPPMVSVIIPIARTNEVTNPSIETNTTNYTAVGGSIARSATEQYHGVYSLAVTPGAGTTDGAYYGTISTTSGQTRAISCKFKGIAGIPYKISIATTGGVDLVVDAFVATGRWQWRYLYYTETATTTRRIYFTKNGSTNTGVFYVDGVQSEVINAGELVSTYIDGDQLGLLVGQQPPAYLWTGTPHASTSMRSALTRAGGYVVNLSTYNFLLTALLSLGMAAPNNVSVPYTILDGARFLRTTKPPRTFSLTGRFQADDYFTYQQGLSDMRQALDRDLVPLQQPLVLMVEPQDECGNAIGDFATVPCIYAGGLEGNDGNLPVEDVAPTFTMYVPYIAGGDAGAALTVQTSVSNANGILQRSTGGVWSALGTGVDAAGIAQAWVRGLDGTLYVGGNATGFGGIANTRGIAKWNGSAWSAMGTGGAVGAIVAQTGLAVAPNGDIVAGGTWTLMGGVANTVNIARWDGAAWNALGTGTNGLVRTVVYGPDGSLYAGGDFTLAGGVANTVRVAKWNGSAWSALSTGANNSVYQLVFGKDGYLYAVGTFTTIGGVAANNIARWNGTAWSALGTGVGGAAGAFAIAIGTNGLIYVGGSFTTIGGVSANNIASWNGTTYAPLGNGSSSTIGSISIDANGVLYATGQFTYPSGTNFTDRVGKWNGSIWLPLDVILPSAPTTVYAVSLSDGTLNLGFGTSGSAVAAAITTVTNSAPGIVYPTLVIKGPSSGTSRISQITNTATGATIYLNYTINAGETATMITDPQHPSFISDFQGDISNTIMPGSALAQLYLAPGVNSLSFLSVASSVAATLAWQRRYNGMADLVK